MYCLRGSVRRGEAGQERDFECVCTYYTTEMCPLSMLSRLLMVLLNLWSLLIWYCLILFDIIDHLPRFVDILILHTGTGNLQAHALIFESQL